ncbi:MAG: 16S rRNA (adenine(1518)-N(6)/adenine(1519)-N(6))-dimethyltransferase RsmA [Alphaproteobacteria bacterium]|nr:16S rRNA (adenine(1518)-N(6)/adenine(1519)-N(6))-dimethyltransferase RsmA [Alphaproteobacteria bacterium]
MVSSEEPPPLRDVIARYGLSARKGLGQHFLLDQNLTAKIARSAGDLTGANVIEVGPGPGGLTRALLESSAATVVAVERDARCIDALTELGARYPGRLKVIEADARRVDVSTLAPAPRHIVANLPYNISTVLLIAWLRQAEAFASMTLMFQREVAERLVASPRTHAYGRLTIAAQWRCHADLLFDLPPAAFVPPPKVTSTVVRLVPRPTPLCDADPTCLERVVAATFGQRRKMIRSSLRSLGIDANLLCEAAAIEPTARAEALDIVAYCALARAYRKMITDRGEGC